MYIREGRSSIISVEIFLPAQCEKISIVPLEAFSQTRIFSPHFAPHVSPTMKIKLFYSPGRAGRSLVKAKRIYSSADSLIETKSKKRKPAGNRVVASLSSLRRKMCNIGINKYSDSVV